MKKIILLFAIASVSLISNAQLLVENQAPYDTPDYLISDVLLGGGIAASNFSWLAGPDNIGFFDGSNSNIGFEEGVLLSTGNLNLVGDGGVMTGIAGTTGEADLELALSNIGMDGFDVNNVTILEFDFVAQSQEMSFRYVFGSVEYTSYTCSNFNDIFGFFLSGPGITGPYSNGAENIALVPGTNTPVGVNTINSGELIDDPDCNDIDPDFESYNIYWVDNDYNGTDWQGVNEPPSPENTVSSLTGFTTPLTATYDGLQCGETYHIKLAIADCADGALNSAVFLEAGSFVSNTLDVVNSLNIDTTGLYIPCGSEVALTASVNNTGYSFLWNTGETTASITVGAGEYWVTATDSLGCSLTSDVVTITSESPAEVYMPPINEFCTGDSYTIVPEVIGGTSPYAFDWGSADEFTQELTVTEGGLYTLTVTDMNNCTTISEVEVIEHSLPNIQFTPDDILICGGNPETVIASGATYYTWSPNVGISNTIGSMVTFSPLNSTVYTVEGVDTNGCVNTAELPVMVTDVFDYDVYTTSVTCPGLLDGSLSLFVDNGAIMPLSYSIDGGVTYHDYNVFTSLSSGLYDVYIRDGNGCVVTDEVLVGASSDPIQVLANSTDALCYAEGSGTLSVPSVIGGSPWGSGYSYTWFHSGTDSIVGTTPTLDVPAGGYYVVVQDSVGCQGTEEVSVEEPVSLSYDVSVEHITCFGESDGHVSVNITGGGIPPYDVEWVDLGGNSDLFLNYIPAGAYQLSVTDANNCQTLIDVEVHAPSAPLSVSASSMNSISCYNETTGSAQVSVVGGTAPYAYQWSSGHVTADAGSLGAGIYEVTVTDDRGCVQIDNVTISENSQILSDITTTSASCYGSWDGSAMVSSSGGYGLHTYAWSTLATTSSIDDLSHGDYWVIIEDELGCIRKDTAYIAQPEELHVVLTANNALCHGDSNGDLSSMVEGGTGVYSYEWFFLGSSIGTNDMLTGLSASNQPYQLIVTDEHNCQQVSYAFIREPKPLVLDTSELVSAYCVNIPTGLVSVVAEGGHLNTGGSYQYVWHTGAEGSVLANQTAGVYTVVVSDDNACQHSITIEIPLEETFESTMDMQELICYEDASGQATINTAGGYAPYTYYWNWPGGSEQVTSESPVYVKDALPAGVSSVTIADGNGCTITNNIEVTQPEQLQFAIHKDQDESCYGDVAACDGTISITALGGTGLYTYAWYDLTGNLIGTETSASNVLEEASLCAGFYNITVSDEHACTGTLSGDDLANPIEIVAGFPVTVTINPLSIVNNIECYGDADAQVSVTNPNSQFTYTWFVNGQEQATGVTATNIQAGEITVTASYESCNTTSAAININQPSAIIANEVITDVSCYAGNDGMIQTDIEGGTGEHALIWGNGEATANLTDLNADTYTLTVTDANGCEQLFDIVVNSPAEITSEFTLTEPLCYGDDNGQAILSLIEGGVAPYIEDWQGEDQENLSAGSYTVLVTDANGCLHNANFTLTQPSQLTAGISESNNQLTASANGGTPAYSYEWLYFGNSQQVGGTTFTPEEDGEYTLVLTDANGCEDRITIDFEMEVNTVAEQSSTSLQIYPNPMNSHLTIELEGVQGIALSHLELIDARGRVVRKTDFKKTHILHKDELSAGIYLLKIKTNNTNFDRKIIINE